MAGPLSPRWVNSMASVKLAFRAFASALVSGDEATTASTATPASGVSVSSRPASKVRGTSAGRVSVTRMSN